MKFGVTKEVFALYPSLSIGVIKCTGLDNRVDFAGDALLADSTAVALEKLGDGPLIDHAFIKNWRGAYKQFNEKKNRSSIEALLRRIVNGKSLPSISPLVDMYNAASVKHFIPCGGEDLDTLAGDLILTIGDGSVPFRQLGANEDEFPPAGEVLYRDDEKVICRAFNWRESDLSKLTEDTTNAIIVVEALSPEDQANMAEALNELVGMIRHTCGAETSSYLIDVDHPVVAL